MYHAVANEEVDVISGYSTDGRVKAFNLKVLEDDKHVFPPYFCAPIVNKKLLNEYPEVRKTLNLLAGKINDSIMTLLNYRVDFKQEKPEVVASDFLKQLNLSNPDRKQGGRKLVIGSKIFTEQYILAHLFSQLINGYTDFDTDIKTGLGGTSVCFDALRKGAIDLYPEYTGTGFLVLLKPTEQEVNNLITDAPKLYNYVSNAFVEKYQIEWLKPLGFNNTYALVIRQQMAVTYNLQNISQLAKIKQ